MSNNINGSFYTQYYTASDVQVDLYLNGKSVNLDLLVGIGFNHTVNSNPFYGLGYMDPIFFNRGNSIGHGQLDIAFRSDQYLPNIINYLNGSTIDSGSKDGTTKTNKTNNSNDVGVQNQISQLQAQIQNGNNDKAVYDQLDALKAQVTTITSSSMIDNSIASIVVPNLEIHIKFNNSNSEHNSQTRTIILYGLKFITDTVQTHIGDQGVIYESYNFMFKNKTNA